MHYVHFVTLILIYQLPFLLSDELECTNGKGGKEVYQVEKEKIVKRAAGSAKCLRKCCPFGQVISDDETGACKNTLGLTNIDKIGGANFGNIIHGNLCESESFSRIVLNGNRREEQSDEFNLSDDGYLSFDGSQLDFKSYCLDLYKGETVAIICTKDEEVEQLLVDIGMIISMPFLLATFIVYALLPERNLHMKALMSYVFTLMLAYMLLVTIQMHATFPTVPCRIMGYSCLFFFIVSFYWMNVICIDIWLAFSGVRGYSGRKSSERKRFLYYCLYAWGMSILHVLVVLIIDLSAKPNAFYHPGIGSGQCFLKNRYPELLYLYFPVGLLICINITMFALTAYKIRKVKQDTKMLKKNESQKHSYENDKQRFNLYLKLLLAMGVNWSMEIISWAVNWQLGYESVYAWYATDFCNAAYGVVIFFIFVFKRSIWKMLQKRYYSFIGKPHLAHSNTTTQTRSTSYSTAATTVHEMHPTSMGASERLMDH